MSVEALDVIGVAVGEKNGCEAIEAGGEGLGAKIGGGVNDERSGHCGRGGWRGAGGLS